MMNGTKEAGGSRTEGTGDLSRLLSDGRAGGEAKTKPQLADEKWLRDLRQILKCIPRWERRRRRRRSEVSGTRCNYRSHDGRLFSPQRCRHTG